MASNTAITARILCTSLIAGLKIQSAKMIVKIVPFSIDNSPFPHSASLKNNGDIPCGDVCYDGDRSCFISTTRKVPSELTGDLISARGLFCAMWANHQRQRTMWLAGQSPTSPPICWRYSPRGSAFSNKPDTRKFQFHDERCWHNCYKSF